MNGGHRSDCRLAMSALRRCKAIRERSKDIEQNLGNVMKFEEMVERVSEKRQSSKCSDQFTSNGDEAKVCRRIENLGCSTEMGERRHPVIATRTQHRSSRSANTGKALAVKLMNTKRTHCHLDIPHCDRRIPT